MSLNNCQNLFWFTQLYEDFENELILTDEIFYQLGDKIYYKPDLIYYNKNDIENFCIKKFLDFYLNM